MKREFRLSGHATRLAVIFTLSAVFIPSLYAQTTPSSELEQREGIWYKTGETAPFSGDVEDPGVTAGRLENGLRVGRWTGWHENKEVAWVSDYESGQMSYHAMYFDNAQMRFEGSFHEGQREGVFKSWTQAGQLSSESTYAQGKREGSYTFWDADGRLVYSAEYADGLLHGHSTWWFENGDKRWETSYIAGERDGVWTQWQKDGNIFMQSEWDNGVLVSRNNPHKHH